MERNDPLRQPRVGISYCRTSEAHVAWVAALAERLEVNGIAVIFDEWDLELGHDLFAFMERLVGCSETDRVLVISDAAYAKRADARVGGVGVEAQLMAKGVYGDVLQRRVIPVVREWDGEGNPCLPAFLKSRVWVGFRGCDIENVAYNRLLDSIFGRPRRPRVSEPERRGLEVEWTADVTAYMRGVASAVASGFITRDGSASGAGVTVGVFACDGGTERLVLLGADSVNGDDCGRRSDLANVSRDRGLVAFVLRSRSWLVASRSTYGDDGLSDYLIRYWGFDEAGAEAMPVDRRSWMIVPVFARAAEGVKAVLYVDSADASCFGNVGSTVRRNVVNAARAVAAGIGASAPPPTAP